MFRCTDSKMPSLAASGFAAQIFLRFAVVLIATTGHLAVNAQKSRGVFLFSLLNSGHTIQHRPTLAASPANVFYGADTLSGIVELTGEEIVFTPQNDTVQRKFILADKKFKGLQYPTGPSKVLFVKRYNSERLFRLLFNASGVKIYDTKRSLDIEPGNIEYNELLLEYEGELYPVVTFWTTSTKRSLIKILNKIFRLSLQPENFKNKEAVMAAVLNYDDRIFSSKN